MLYNTGTIAINGNSATGTGTNWTAPASQVRAGQTIIVMSNPVQLFQISSVNSATSMTVTPAASPALSGQKYGILVSDIISVDGLAQAMSHLIKEYDENIGAWETFASTSANQLVTVTINGTSLSIPAIGGLARKGSNSDITSLSGLTTALSIEQGGTGAKSSSGALKNLGVVGNDGLIPVSLGGTGASTPLTAREKLSAASSGSNSDITSITGVIAPSVSSNSRPTEGFHASINIGGTYGSVIKGFNQTVFSSNWNIGTSFGTYVDASGFADNSGPTIVFSNGSGYTKFWHHIAGTGVIQTPSGNITPAVSDIRVKNEKKVITEVEAVEFIHDLESILYTLKWSPDKLRVGFRAQDIFDKNPDLIDRAPLSDGEDGMIEDGMVVDVAEVASGYLVPVVKKLLREVAELRADINVLKGE